VSTDLRTGLLIDSRCRLLRVTEARSVRGALALRQAKGGNSCRWPAKGGPACLQMACSDLAERLNERFERELITDSGLPLQVMKRHAVFNLLPEEEQCQRSASSAPNLRECAILYVHSQTLPDRSYCGFPRAEPTYPVRASHLPLAEQSMAINSRPGYWRT